MSDATIREAIRLRMVSFGAGIGRVHDYERWAVQTSDFLGRFQDETTRKIFGWEIMRVAMRIERKTMHKIHMVHRFVVRGYYGLSDDDATEKAVNTLVDQIVLDFAMNPIAGTQGRQSPESKISTRMFGSILCHVPEITMPDITEVVSPPAEAGETDLAGIDLEYYLQPEPDDPPVVDAEDTVNFDE